MNELTDARSKIIDQDVMRRIKSQYPDFNFDRLKPNIESIEHGNLDIQFVGVHHIVETIAAYREAIEQAIADADIVVLEASIETSGEALRSGESYLNTVQSSGSDRAVMMHFPQYRLHENSSGAFFSETENIARKHRKQIVVCDPLSDQRMLQSAVAVELQGGIPHDERLSQLNEQIREYSKIAAALGAGVSAGAAVAGPTEASARGGLKILFERYKASSSEEKKESRRSFLKRGAVYAAGYGIGSKVIEKAEANVDVINHKGKDDQEKFTQYNEIDFRDVSVATGLDQLSRGFTKKMKVAIVYGDYHRNGIRQYLENPNLRQAKFALYKPFRDVAPPQMTAYKYELAPEVVSGTVEIKSIPESKWGYWKQVVQANI